jgi:hypothetical protein
MDLLSSRWSVAGFRLFAILTIAVGGCVFPGQPMKAGATQEDFVHDAAACRAQAMAAAPPVADESGQTKPDAYFVTRKMRECLQAQGWYLPPGFVLPL